MVGRVVSVKMQNTAVVIVESKKTHPVYRKSFRRSKKYLVDDQFEVSLGDVVIFEKIAPISKRKHWKITKVLGKDIVSLEQAELLEEANEAIAEVMPEDKIDEEVSSQSLEVDAEDKKEDKKTKKETKEPKETKAKKGGKTSI
jgi:small subunit ribosomal protein S17